MDNADRAQEVIDQRMQDALDQRNSRWFHANQIGPINCEDCDEKIPAARRDGLPGVTTCIECQGIREQRARGWR